MAYSALVFRTISLEVFRTTMKFVFFFLFAFLFMQMTLASPTPEEETTKNGFEDFKNKADTFVKENLQIDKLFEGLSDKMKELGEKIEAGAKEIAKNFQKNDETAEKN